MHEVNEEIAPVKPLHYIKCIIPTCIQVHYKYTFTCARWLHDLDKYKLFPFQTRQKIPLTPTDICPLSSVGNGTIPIHFQVSASAAVTGIFLW